MHFYCCCVCVCVGVRACVRVRGCVHVCVRAHARKRAGLLFLAAGFILFSIQCKALFIYPRHFAIFLFCWCIIYHVMWLAVDYRKW